MECRTPKEALMNRTILVMVIFLLAVSTSAEEKRYPVPLGDSPTIGPLDAPVTIVEFLDFQ
jgi:protein-disulfide isomerase